MEKIKQPKVKIVSIHGEDYGIKNVVSLFWSSDGHLVNIKVNFMGDYHDLMHMYDLKNTGEYLNTSGNLIGKIIWE